VPESPSLTAAEVAEAVGGRLRGDGSRRLTGLAALDAAGPDELSFLAQAAYRRQAAASRAGCILVGAEEELPGHDVIACEDPYRAFALAMRAFHPEPARPAGVAPTASVSPEAELGEGVSVGPGAVVEAGARIGAGSAVLAGAVVGRGCRLGEDCVLHPNAVLYPGTELGDRVAVHANAVLGSDGFGYASGRDGHFKIVHAGRVVVEDDCEIGAGSCIDRAVMGETRIGAGTKIDNLVQVAHNVRIGAGSILVSQSGISGSSTLGRGCVVAGQSGVAGHLNLGDGARVGAKSAVYEDVPAGETVTGIPAIPHARWKRLAASLGRLPDLLRRMRRLEKESGDRDE
jgi:UDP-3-O-[3-hydroxymyristoyl] glucosamine N-acyltransferase